jgi:hypothetical protein
VGRALRFLLLLFEFLIFASSRNGKLRQSLTLYIEEKWNEARNSDTKPVQFLQVLFGIFYDPGVFPENFDGCCVCYKVLKDLLEAVLSFVSQTFHCQTVLCFARWRRLVCTNRTHNLVHVS